MISETSTPQSTPFATRSVDEKGVVTLVYTFTKVVARPYINKYDERRYNFEVEVGEHRPYMAVLDSGYLSLQDEWNLLSGVESACRCTLASYRDRLRKEEERISKLLVKS